MTPFKKNLACSISLIIADFISFTLSLYIAIGVLSILLHNFHERVPDDQIEPWISLHWLLGICCVGWFGIRLRHYF
ncbi:UDP-phosphate galactose phosphotransferase, partial [Pluralibacter gergoviae]